ncbi:metallophosphoesterase [Proteiniclasticum sp. SCR006]|uniref:Metallophosphoesterase n=1 Tax=Proteiniclasticum aestuarii TaxID=2817862 RepID=A0A939H9Z3_9CLOT|nr:metallophosphoesterase [Proteiniclasticum aestuarii]
MNRPSTPVLLILVSIMLAILGSGVFYVGRKLFRWLDLVLPGSNQKLYLVIPVMIGLSFVLAFSPLDVSIRKYLVWFNWFIVGVWAYFLLFFLVSDTLLFIGKRAEIIPTPVPQIFTISIGWVVLAVVAGLTAYGTYHGRQITQVSYTVQVEKESSLESLNIVLVADMHLGYQNDEKWLARIVDEINAFEPDIVAISGDVFNDNYGALADSQDAVRSLQSITSTYGVYAALGNHDGGNTYGEMLRVLEESNVILLQDDYRVIEDHFVIVGRSDPSPIGGGPPPRKDTSVVFAGIDENLPVIVIDHQAASTAEYGKKTDMILGGHTHKGQMFPGNLVTDLMFEVDHGYYQRDEVSPHIIITSGVGIWGPPFRIGTDNEVVQILVEFKR